MARLGLNWQTIGTLLRLRWRLTLRQFSRERGRIIGAIIGLLVFGPIVIFGAIGTAFGYLYLEPVWSSLLLTGVLTVLWLFWIAFPILFAQINEGLDVSRLLIYPVPARDIIAATLLSPVFDYPTYLVLPLFVAIVVGFGFSPALPLVIIALLLAFMHMVIISQLVLVTAGGILQSRRFRDLSIIFIAIFSSSCYFLSVGIEQLFDLGLNPDDLIQLNILGYAQWLPTGALSQVIIQSTSGSWVSALLWLSYASILLLALITVWYRLMIRLTTGGGYFFNPRPRSQPEEVPVQPQRSSGTTLGAVFSFLREDVAELLVHELRSIWRIPQRRAALLQGIVVPIFFYGSFFLGDTSSSGDLIPAWAGLSLPPFALFLFWALTQNMLAWEGRGLAMLLLTPVTRQHIFLAKGGALMLVAGSMYAILGIVTLVVQPDWLSVAGLLTGLGCGLAVMAVTSVSSVLFPVGINLESKQIRGSFQQRGGLRATLGNLFLVPLALILVAMPGGLALLAAWRFEQIWLGFLAAAGTIAYGGALFWFGTRLAGRLLLSREPEVIAVLRQKDEDGQ